MDKRQAKLEMNTMKDAVHKRQMSIDTVNKIILNKVKEKNR